MINSWYTIHGNNTVSLKLFVNANSKTTTIKKIDTRGIHIGLHAKPVDGKANEELRKYLSTLFDIKISEVILKSGERNKNKIIVIPLTAHVKKVLDSLS